MLSIENTYSIDELREYGERVAKLLPGEAIEWVVELKIDGVAVALTTKTACWCAGVTARQRPGGRRRDPQHPHVGDVPAAARRQGFSARA